VLSFVFVSKDYYKAAIRQGLILVSDNKVDPSYKIQGKDVLTHIVHRHEPAVAICPTKDTLTGKHQLVKIIDETEDLIVLDKPGTLPIHPCGGYHLNSLTSMLEGDTLVPTDKKYFNIHRLDRLTSGLVILAKSSAVAKHFIQYIRQRDCKKYYLARVQGRFPLNLEQQQHSHEVDRIHASSEPGAVPQDGVWSNVEDPDETPLDIAKDRNAHGYWITDMSDTTVQGNVSLSDYAKTENCNVDECLAHLDQHHKANDSENSKAKHAMLWLHLACPTRISKPKDGVCEAGRFDDLEEDAYLKTVKPAQTSFAVIKYDAPSDSTLVLCRPVTGRTHQIRIHLQYLGHPIGTYPTLQKETSNHPVIEFCPLKN
jgi:23S rRNA-/tRNA-specific pseudouridylate synthase